MKQNKLEVLEAEESAGIDYTRDGQFLLDIYRGAAHEAAKRDPFIQKLLINIAGQLRPPLEMSIIESLTDSNANHELIALGYSPEYQNNEHDTVKIHTYSEAMIPLPPQTWIINSLISQGSLSVIVGSAGSMKTYLMIQAGLCVAGNRNWLGHKTTQVPVLFLDEENGKRRMCARIQEVNNGEIFPESLPFYFASMQGFNFADSKWLLELRKIITENKIGLVVIDSLVDVLVGVDENSAQATGIILRSLGQLAKETEAAIVIIHHKNKSGEYRGSTAILGMVDLMLELNKNKITNKLNLTVIKSRDIESNYSLTMQPLIKDGKFSVLVTGSDTDVNPLRDSILAYLITFQNTNVRTIMEYLLEEPIFISQVNNYGNNPSQEKEKFRARVRKEIGTLIKRKQIIRTNDGGRGTEALYSVLGK